MAKDTLSRFRPVFWPAALLVIALAVGQLLPAQAEAPTSAPDFAAVIRGVNPSSDAGLRADAFVDVPVTARRL